LEASRRCATLAPVRALVTLGLTALALVAFASNSLLCRLALAGDSIDPVAFTAARLGSGAVVLWLVLAVRKGARPRGHFKNALALLAYALPFSLAYVRLNAGVGALLLFGAVQLTMLAAALRAGERPRALEWIAFAIAFGGLVYLVLPGLSAPDPIGAALMIVAGIAWGIYSLFGKGATDPAGVTGSSFGWAALLVLPIAALAYASLSVTPRGLLLAIASGAITSGLGYVVWYAALPRLSTTRAALVQLAVPALAAVGGTALLAEPFSQRLVLAMTLALGGIALGIFAKSRRDRGSAAR
jgi:drug/metabolite transporter (DMT)-like permease